MLPADEAAVVQRAAAAAAGSAEQRVRKVPGDERASPAARPLLHPPSGSCCFHGSVHGRISAPTACFSLQQAHIPASIMAVLEANKKPEPKPLEPVVEMEVTD